MLLDEVTAASCRGLNVETDITRMSTAITDSGGVHFEIHCVRPTKRDVGKDLEQVVLLWWLSRAELDLLRLCWPD